MVDLVLLGLRLHQQGRAEGHPAVQNCVVCRNCVQLLCAEIHVSWKALTGNILLREDSLNLLIKESIDFNEGEFLIGNFFLSSLHLQLS